ncbi:MAG: sigma-70 family RNA polymerase sigma factor [Acidobacteria bacterium]|nr:sigma-70 family RNA polymerase sigma factor [Acidobacteriota bacterium]
MPSDETLSRLRERIFGFAASRLSREAAEDLAQETMLVLHEKYAHVAEPAELLPLAFQVIRFKMAAAVRKSARRGEARTIPVEDLPLASREADPERAAARSEMRQRLLAAVSGLGDRCKEMLRLKLEGRSFEEIRQHFQAASINTVYTWDARCRKALLERMGGNWEKEP